jgi:sulfopyruvate decarboxylase subunit beta
MKASDAVAALLAHRTDEIAFCALGMAAGEWWRQSRDEGDFYLHGAMGFSASMALGFALMLPQAKVWAINTDGSLCMNLGGLLTEAGQGAPNLKHFVIDNKVYETVGAVPMVNGGRTDYAAMARAAGFPQARVLRSVAEINEAMPQIMAAPGPVMTVLEVETDGGGGQPMPMDYEGPEIKYRFGRSIEKRFGVRVFGDQGY